MGEPPSGDWTGFYEQAGRARQDLFLSFADGRLSGAGADRIGLFSVRGGYAGDDVWWTKRYHGGHDVSYRGGFDGGAIGGVWEIGSWSRGAFRIWPVSGVTEATEAVSEAVRRPS